MQEPGTRKENAWDKRDDISIPAALILLFKVLNQTPTMLQERNAKTFFNQEYQTVTVSEKRKQKIKATIKVSGYQVFTGSGEK